MALVTLLAGAALSLRVPPPVASVAAPQTTALQALAAAAKDDVRGIVSVDAANAFLPDSAYWIGVAFRQWLGPGDEIAVGRDPRTHSFDISTAFCNGANARDAGPATTPAMLEALLEQNSIYSGAVMVTASHLPAEWNGLKFFSRNLRRGLNKKEVKEVMALAVELGETGGDTRDSAPAASVPRSNNLDELYEQAGGSIVTSSMTGTVVPNTAAPVPRLDGFMTPYLEKLRTAVKLAAQDGSETPLAGMRVCVNPGNGAGGLFATEVLAPLGADTSFSIHLEPDGTFPNHQPNPEDKAHVKATVEAVAARNAEVGVMLDTDVDRCGLIDGSVSPPEEVNRNRLIALCALDALEANAGRGVIVTDSVTSKGMPAFIAGCGGEHDRFKMGYRDVIDRAAETTPEPALLAIETSGHSAWRDNNFVDDGCYTAARLLGRLARERRMRSQPTLGLLEMLGGSLEEPAESIKVKMTVAGGLPSVPKAEEALCDALRQTAAGTGGWEIEQINHDGLRCAVGADGWLIIRGSLHEPSVSVQTESDVAGGTAAICAKLLEFVVADGGCEAAGIDIQPMRDAAGN